MNLAKQFNRRYLFCFVLTYLISFLFFSVPAFSSKAHAPILSPVPGAISLGVPRELNDLPLAKFGLLDVTGEPFGADPTGSRDSTNAIQKAVNYARDAQMVCFFPEGDYLVSDTIECEQIPVERGGGKVGGARFFPNVLMGSTKGRMPRIILAANSRGYGDSSKPKYVVHFWAQHLKRKGEPQPNISFNQMILNMEIVISEGNAGAVAIRHRAAQGSAIENVIIDATHGYCGIEGGIGSGGSIANVSIKGGQVGMSLVQTQPSPTIVGITLAGQTKTPLIYGGRQSLSAVGVRIDTSCSGPAILVTPQWSAPHHGEVSLVDSRIDFHGGSRLGVQSARNVYLRNVYMRGVNVAVKSWGSSELSTKFNGWVCFKEYVSPGKPYRPHKGFKYEHVVIEDGVVSGRTIAEIEPGNPPYDLVGRHLWPRAFPSFEADGAVNIKEAYGAKGDGRHDDTFALQRAIDEHEIVFLPKGVYRLTAPLQLRKDTKLFGVARHLSILLVESGSSSFKPGKPQPAVRTSQAQEANTVLAFLGIYTPVDFAGAYALEWMCGGNSVVRDVNFILDHTKSWPKGGKPQRSDFVPHVRITGKGGGKWYNFYQERVRRGKGYRHILVEDTSGPLAFYQLDVEHGRSDALAELRRASNVDIYGLKGESRIAKDDCTAILLINRSKTINVYGYGGNAATKAGCALFRIVDSSDIRIVNAVDTQVLNTKRRPNPDKWHMVIQKSNGRSFALPPLTRPILYRQK